MSVPVYVDPARVDRTDSGGANFDLLVAEAVLAKLGEKDDEVGETSSKVMELVSNDLGFQLLKQVRADPSLIGKTVTLKGPVRADAGTSMSTRWSTSPSYP
jgi:phosphate transport system permease protein